MTGINNKVRTIMRLLVGKGFSSSRYWEDRYKNGGNSGAGSYSNLALFKAEFINKFISDHSIQSVIEFGSGDGNQLKLSNYPRYLGFDVSEEALNICRNLFCEDKNKQFKNYNTYNSCEKADLTLSLDVIYHLVEDSVYKNYMDKLFRASKKWVIIYSSNFYDFGSEHVRHRKFVDWIIANQPNFSLFMSEKNKYPYLEDNPEHTSFADFYVFSRE